MEDGLSRDDVHAHRIFRRSPRPSDAEGVIFGSLESEDYFMKYPKRGKCYIFNHIEFKSRTLEVRDGAEADAKSLCQCFSKLGFDVKVFVDLTIKEVDRELQKAGKEDHKDNSCFVCCIMTHGTDGVLHAKDGIYLKEQVFAPFRGDVCESLAGKPKIFFIQACQGTKVDSGVNMTCKESTDSGEDRHKFKISTHADFLIVHSSVPGFRSFRDDIDGSWFIQVLCAMLERHMKDKDLMEILTIVNRTVSYYYESYRPDDNNLHQKKQVPCVMSTLTRNIRFPVPELSN